jgi:hypothetical protein
MTTTVEEREREREREREKKWEKAKGCLDISGFKITDKNFYWFFHR